MRAPWTLTIAQLVDRRRADRLCAGRFSILPEKEVDSLPAPELNSD